MAFVLPLISSLGALLFEFSISQYLAMSLGNSAFGYTFVVGVFLLFMGLGAFTVEHFNPGERAGRWLIIIQLGLVVLCVASLPLLTLTASSVKSMQASSWDCQSMICTHGGLTLVFIGAIFLALVGCLVGSEIPLYSKCFQAGIGRILAGDYLGAFAAGLLFALIFLPSLGLFGTLIFAGSCHLVVAVVIRIKKHGRDLLLDCSLMATTVLLALVMVFLQNFDHWLLERITRQPHATEHSVLFFKRTQKQSILLTEETLPTGKKDRRLYLDGFMQFSSAWNLEQYHQRMLQPARERIAADSAKILILGGGDGILAKTALQLNSSDQIELVDYDCELLSAMKSDSHLRELAPEIWENPQVKLHCADAFWFLQNTRSKFDLILVDFPHSVGDAAAARVESLEFFFDLHQVLATDGLAVLQHESFQSRSQLCVAETLSYAGFEVESLAVLPDQPNSEAMILAKKSRPKANIPFNRVQTALYQPCQDATRLGTIFTGI